MRSVLMQVHGWLMFAGFVVLMPAGILTANLFSRTHARHPWWFYMHATLTGSGAVAGVVGFVIGLMLMIPSRYALIHRWIGISIIISIAFQVLLSSSACFRWLLRARCSMPDVQPNAAGIGSARMQPNKLKAARNEGCESGELPCR